MSRILYAAYGSNLHPLRLRERIPLARLLGSARLADMTLRFHKRGQDGSGKCNIIPGAGEVHAAIYALDLPGKLRLHEIEGVGQGYEEQRLHVPGFGECFTYSATASHIDDALLPFAWYRQLVVAGCRYHGFPRAYVARIGRLPAREDPDRERVARHSRLVERVS